MKATDGPHRIRNRLWLASLALTLTVAAAGIGGMVWWSTTLAENQLDDELRTEIIELVRGPLQEGPEALALEIRRRVLATDSLGHVYLFAESQRTIIEGTWSAWPDEMLAGSDFQTFTLNDEPPKGVGVARQVRVALRALPSGRQLAVGHDVTEHHRLRNGLKLGGLGALVLALGLAMAGGLLVSRRLLDRVATMQKVVLGILRGRRDSRVPVSDPPDEFDQLAEQFNELLDENQALLGRMREVTDEVAHDLRTPLARLRAQIETGLGGADGLETEQRELLHALHEEVDDILDTFNALLHIAQIETGRAREEMVQVELSSLVETACELYEPVAEEAGLELRGRIESSISVVGNRHLLAQALTNLIENALKYAGRGVVTVSLSPADDAGRVTLSVSDQGPGIPAEAHARVLQKFARLEQARSRPGAGLGLSFVAAVADLHDASLEFKEMSPGLRVSLQLTAAP
ncbi:MAG: HAMP domain-containing sensor histidine kinase [Myxococcota bacterium]